MGSICAEQQHKFHLSHQLFLGKKTLRDIEIPPRKLLSRRAAAAAAAAAETGDFLMDSPRSDETLLQKYLPYNTGADDDDDADPYSSDHFRMYEFKVRRCTRSRSHDWTDCPFAHPGEKARRRDPRRFHYSGTVCSEFRRGSCSRGENCEFAHGVFECWLHPARYRTEACKDGKNCKRKVCFFAHTPRQLRVLPAQCHDSPNSPIPVEKKLGNFHCCTYCHSAITASPTSTLIDMANLSPPMSPSLSPPLSPVNSSQSQAGYSPISRFRDRLASVESCGLNQFGNGGLSYKDALTELMSSLEVMNVNDTPHAMGRNRNGNGNGNLSWVDVSNLNGDEQQQQFVLSPSTPTPSGSAHFFGGGDYYSRRNYFDEKFNDNNGLAGPDLGWVNDLLTEMDSYR